MKSEIGLYIYIYNSEIGLYISLYIICFAKVLKTYLVATYIRVQLNNSPFCISESSFYTF